MSCWGKRHLSSELLFSEDTENACYACTQKTPKLFPETTQLKFLMVVFQPLFFQAFFGFIFLLIAEVAFITRCTLFQVTAGAHVLPVNHPI